MSKNGITPPADRVECILRIQRPTSTKAHHRFIPHAAEILHPLHAVLQGSPRKLKWGHDQDTAFQKAKQALSDATLLVYPNAKAVTAVTCDASGTAVGASLDQLSNGEWKPLAFFSRKLSRAELKYSAFDRELLAIYLSIKHFRYFLEGQQFTIYTDHMPLTTAIASATDRSPRQARHLSYIAEFTTDMRHVPGKSNVVADALSRSCVELNAVLTSPIDFRDMATSQSNDPDSIKYKESADTGMALREVDLGEGTKLLCDTARGRSRPFVPAPWRKKVFDAIHGLAHLGKKPTLKAVSSEFVWPSMRKDITNWCKLCHQSKVSQHTRTPLQNFEVPNGRFDHLHVDIVGPLTPSQGFTYLFTIIDRFTRWTEAIPMTDSTAITCARSLFREWISRFGVPGEITSDRGPQFTSELWDQLHCTLGTKASRTTSYHLQANGMVEKFHRTMKASLMARLGNNPNWTEELLVVMLGLRTAFKEDLGCSSAELVYGTHLRLPWGFFEAPEAFEPPRPVDFLPSLHRATWHRYYQQARCTRELYPGFCSS